MINIKQNKYSLALTYNYKPSIPNEFSYEFSSVVNQITEINKDAPVYLFKQNQETLHFALEIKESTTRLYNELLLLFKPNTKKDKFKKYVCSNPTCLSIRMLSNAAIENSYLIHIDNVASGQINKSSFVETKQHPFHEGSYRFSITKNDTIYKFSLDLKDSSTNQEIFKMLTDVIESADIGITCSLSDERGKIALSLAAQANRQDTPSTFKIEDNGSQLIQFYKLNNIIADPVPSHFSVNSDFTESFGTNFIIDNCFQITLLNKHTDDIEIYAVDDDNYALSSLNSILNTINYLLSVSRTIAVRKLEHELVRIIEKSKDELYNMGITFDNDYSLTINETANINAIAPNSFENLYSSQDSFASVLLYDMEKISINPMEYIPKKMVAYPDMSKPHFPNPYMTSIYSGFIYSSYC